jgi:hypothetical protein
MILINCPDYFSWIRHKHPKRVFLAGGITNCPDWQQDVIKSQGNEDIVLMNPRRVNFDVSDPTQEEFQIEWEHCHLIFSNIILFWFPEETLCPITLFELGKVAAQGKAMVVGCHPGYKRRRDVIHQLGHLRPGIVVRDSLEAVIADLNHAQGK